MVTPKNPLSYLLAIEFTSQAALYIDVKKAPTAADPRTIVTVSFISLSPPPAP